jgi:hypothetical protein
MSKKLTLHPDNRETREAIFHAAATTASDTTPEGSLPRGRITFTYFEKSKHSPASVNVNFDGLAIYAPDFEELEKVLKETRPDIELVLTENSKK